MSILLGFECNGVNLWGGQFGQCGQKPHKNYKIGILGAKQWVGAMVGTSQFFMEW